MRSQFYASCVAQCADDFRILPVPNWGFVLAGVDPNSDFRCSCAGDCASDFARLDAHFGRLKVGFELPFYDPDAHFAGYFRDLFSHFALPCAQF